MTSSEEAKPEVAAAGGAETAAVSQAAGGLPCTRPGCPASGALCAYIDRRGRRCPTAWCPDHRLVIEGVTYCRRHAGVVSALPRGATPLPDLDTRAPSLVSWVAREVDADIRHLLLAEAPLGEGARLAIDPVYRVLAGQDRRPAWERAWKLVDRAGRSLRVSLLVEEGDDAEVAVRVNSEMLDRARPPWIAERPGGLQPPPDVDTQRRKDFNRRLLVVIRAGIRREWTDLPPS